MWTPAGGQTSEVGLQEPVLRMEGLAWREGPDMLEPLSMLGRHRWGLWRQAGVCMSGLLWLAGLHMLGLRSQAAGRRMSGLQAAEMRMLGRRGRAAGPHMLALQWLAVPQLLGL